MLVLVICLLMSIFYLFILNRSPSDDDRIFYGILNNKHCYYPVTTIDRKAPSVFVGDMNGHHKDGFGPARTDIYGISTLDFATVSSRWESVTGLTHHACGTLTFLAVNFCDGRAGGPLPLHSPRRGFKVKCWLGECPWRDISAVSFVATRSLHSPKFFVRMTVRTRDLSLITSTYRDTKWTSSNSAYLDRSGLQYRRWRKHCVVFRTYLRKFGVFCNFWSIKPRNILKCKYNSRNDRITPLHMSSNHSWTVSTVP